MPVKKGLVAPQNIFIQTIIKKFDGSPDRNFVLGNAQVVDLPIIYCNDGFCELTGYTRAELVQKHCSCDFLCGEDTSESAARAVKEALRGTEEKHVEILYYRKDGSQFLCSVLVAPIKSEDGMAAMYIVNHEDVTWSPNKDEVTLPRSCFQFPLNMNKIPSAIRRKKHGGDVLGADDEDEDSAKSSRALDTHITCSSSGNSDLNSPDSPSCVPVMSVLPPSPPVSSEVRAEFSSSLSTPEKSESSMGVLPQKSSSLFDVSKASNTESESLIKPMQSIGYGAKSGNMLYIPEFKGRLSAACSESVVWNARGRPWSDGHNVDLRGSTIITSPVLNIHPRKTEKVAQVMSLGADVLPEYKLQAPKIHPWTILHYSPFKAFWDWLILFLVIYTAIVTPYVASFVLSRDKLREKLNKDPETRSMYSDPLVIVDYIVDVMFIVDIFINFRTTFVDSNDEVVSHPCRIAIHYCKTWFVIDLVAAIPFELLIMIGDTDQTTTLIGLLKTARLLRLVRVARKLDHYSEYGMAVLCLLMCSFALLAHWLACIWYFIGNIERESNTTTLGWLDSLATQINQPYNDSVEMSGPDLKSKYVTALYFTLSSLTSVGFGNVSPNTNTEKIFSICIMLVGSLFYAAIFGNVAAIIARLYSTTSRYHAQMQKVREFIRFYQIPNPLRQRVEDYAHHVWSYTNGIDMDQVLKNFPECLQADICLHLNSGLLHCYPAFRTAPQGCLRALALRIRTTHLPPGDYIVYQGDEVSHLYFVLRGTVEVLDNDVIMAILSKGDSFGEDFVNDPDRPVTISSASIRALTYCDLRMISREDVLRILAQYPSYRDNFIRDLEVTFNLRRSGADTNSVSTDRNDGYRAPRAASPVIALEKAQTMAKVNGPVHGSVVNGKNETAPKQATNFAVCLEIDTPPTSGSSLHENGANSLVSQLRELNASVDEGEKRRRSQSCPTNSNSVEITIEPSSNCFSSGHQPGECCSSVCKDCCSCFREMQAKLDNLFSCLQRLETTLSADVEAIFGLLRAYNDAIKEKKLDFHTQV